MKSFLIASTLAVLGAATTAEGIVLPKGGHEYHQYGVNFNAPRAVEPSSGGSVTIPMYQHNKRDLSDVEQTLAFAESQRDYVLRKWGKTEKADQARKRFAKRQVLGLSDYGQDNFYFGQVSVGTPKQNFNVILDTGSSDFWVADTACTSSQCGGSALFNPDASSTYISSTTPFQIRYGTGAVQGRLAADTVSLAGYTVNNQTFAIAEQLAPRSLNAPTSGIMGMGFQSLASSEATPFWQVLVEQGRLSENLFTFQMARNVRTATRDQVINPGGIFTLGQLDSNQYNGDINYVPLTGQEGYWTIPLDSVSVNGDSGTISGDSASAIDTGTTLIIAPPSVARSLYARIPGSQSLSGLFSSGDDGYYSIPCNSNVDLRFTFGGQSYAINSADMTSGTVDNQGNCLGGILGESLGAGAPGFIVGNVFLKNVFSVYRYEPAAVGFASLKGQSAQTAATTTGAIQAGSPTATASSGASSVAGNSPPSFSTVSADSSDSSLVGGSGLPQPTAQTAGDASSPAITPANGVDSTNGNSGSGLGSAAPSLHSHIAMGPAACLVALAAGLFAVL